MRPRTAKSGPKGESAKTTSNPAAQGDQEMTARMHFYAVRSTGDQLRWATAPRTGKRPDRMEGR
jgi:hypothetical protein